MKNILSVFFFTVAMACCLPSDAQRLIPKQKGIEMAGGIPVIKSERLFARENFGVSLSFTSYLKRENYVFVLAEYERQALSYRSYRVPMRDALLQAGYMQPFFSDRGKNVLAYMGVAALAGYEELNEDKKLLPDGATLLDRSRFVYGGALHGSVELFLTDNILFVLKAQGRLLFGADVHRFRPALSAGFKLNF